MTEFNSNRRRQDAHQKIKLGGLVVLAGLADVDPAILVGVLATARHQIDAHPELAVQFREIGAPFLKGGSK
jgi:purine nucleoside permease